MRCHPSRRRLEAETKDLLATAARRLSASRIGVELELNIHFYYSEAQVDRR